MRLVLATGCSALAVLLTSAGCGGGGYSSPGAPTPTSVGTATVTIVGDRGVQSFSPNPLMLSAGQTVSWRNNDSVVHRIVSNDGSFSTSDVAPGATSAGVSVPSDGANYHCSIHPTMIGAIAGTSTGRPPPCTGDYCY